MASLRKRRDKWSERIAEGFADGHNAHRVVGVARDLVFERHEFPDDREVAELLDRWREAVDAAGIGPGLVEGLVSDIHGYKDVEMDEGSLSIIFTDSLGIWALGKLGFGITPEQHDLWVDAMATRLREQKNEAGMLYLTYRDRYIDEDMWWLEMAKGPKKDIDSHRPPRPASE